MLRYFLLAYQTRRHHRTAEVDDALNHMIAHILKKHLYHPLVVKEKQQFWKRILIVDDDADITLTFKTVIEESDNDNDLNKRIEVYTPNDPIVALSNFNR